MNTKYVLHPWHSVSYGTEAPQKLEAIVEIPLGSSVKYEIDKTTGLLRMDRVIYSSFHYPINYGFIPQTLGEDGDPLDILVICTESINPLCIVNTTVIGNMQMIDHGEKDDKIIAVATNDPSVSHVTDMSNLPPHFINTLRNFFEQYKVLENKKVIIEDFQNKAEAYRVIEAAITNYQKKFANS